MLFSTLYRTRIWLSYVWYRLTNWLDYFPAYITDEDADEIRFERRLISDLLCELDINFFNIYKQEEAAAVRKECVKFLTGKWKPKNHEQT